MTTEIEHEFRDRHGRMITVREVLESDAAALLQHIRLADQESTFLSREPGELQASEAQERQYISRLRGQVNAIMIVAFHAGELIGSIDFVGGQRRRTHHTGEFGLTVRRAYWGSGIGGHLLDTLLAWAPAQQVRKIKLRVQAHNGAAIALYQKRGFEEEGRLKRELKVGDDWVDLLVMARWLEPW